MKCRALRFGKKNRDALKAEIHSFIRVCVHSYCICVPICPYIQLYVCLCVLNMDLCGFCKSGKFQLDIAVQIPFTLCLHYTILAPYCALNTHTHYNTNINYYSTQNANKTNFISNLSNAFRRQHSKVYKYFQFYAQKKASNCQAVASVCVCACACACCE